MVEIKSNIPDELFHITKESNLKSILQEGLIPKAVPEASESLGGLDENAVYLTSDLLLML